MKFFTSTWARDMMGLALFLLVLFGTPFLGSRPLMTPDEGRYAEIAREMVVTGDYVTPHLDGVKYFEKPPLFYWIETVPIRLFGLSEWSLRSMTALIGLLGCLMVYGAVRKLYDRRAGLLSSVILATSLLYSSMAHMISPDATVCVLVTASLLAFLLGTHQPAGRRRSYFMWAMYIFAALATLTKGLIGVIFPALIIFIWLCVTHNWRELKTYCLPAGILLFLAIAAPWHLLVQRENPEFFHFYFYEQHFLRYFTSYADRAAPFWFFPVSVLIGFFPWTAFLLGKPLTLLTKFNENHRDDTRFFQIWVVAIFVFFTFSRSELLHYALPLIPALAILLGCYFASIWDQPGNQAHWGFAIVLVLGCGASLAGALAGQPDQAVYWAVSMALLMVSALVSGLTYAYKAFAQALLP